MRPSIASCLFVLATLAIAPAHAADAPAPAARTIVLVRHGNYVPDPAADPKLGPGLSPLGLAQAHLAGARLAAQPQRFDALYVSPLQRARATMDTVRAELKLPPGGYALDDRLREIGYGHWEGSTLAQAQVSHPELYASRERDKWSALPPGGESYASVQMRMREWPRLRLM